VNERFVLARIPETPEPRVTVVFSKRAVMVRGYTAPLRELLREMGFKYFMGNRAWIAQPLTPPKVKEVVDKILRMAEEKGLKVEVIER